VTVPTAPDVLLPRLYSPDSSTVAIGNRMVVRRLITSGRSAYFVTVNASSKGYWRKSLEDSAKTWKISYRTLLGFK